MLRPLHIDAIHIRKVFLQRRWHSREVKRRLQTLLGFASVLYSQHRIWQILLLGSEDHRCSLGRSSWPRWSIHCSSGSLSNTAQITDSDDGDLWRANTGYRFTILSANPTHTCGTTSTHYVLALGICAPDLAAANPQREGTLWLPTLRMHLCALVCDFGVCHDRVPRSAYRILRLGCKQDGSAVPSQQDSGAQVCLTRWCEGWASKHNVRT